MSAAIQQTTHPIAPIPMAVRVSAPERVAVALVGGDTLFRQGLRRLFDDTSIEVVADAAAPVEALGRLGRAPQVIVLIEDRKSVVQGKRVSGRVNTGGCRT